MSKVLIDIDLKRIRGLIDHFGGSGSEEFEDYDQENARDEFTDMLQLIFAGQEIVGINEWQPIETAPKDGTSILLHNNIALGIKGKKAKECDDTNTVVGAWWANEGEEEEGEWICYMSMVRDPNCPFDPTHWMPLPNPPKQEKEIV